MPPKSYSIPFISQQAARELLAACECVLHELEHGEAGEGNINDIAWCADELRDAIAKARGD